MAAIEIDGRLAEALRARLDPDRVRVIHGDVLTTDLAAVGAAFEGGAAQRLVVVGNLPYAISKPVAQKLVAERQRVSRAVLMFQREVAERLTAPPGGAAYGPLSVLCGQAFVIERLFDVPPRAFRPPPDVCSSVTRWTPRPPAAGLDPRIERALRACLAAAFARRRQTLRNNLRAALGSSERADELLAAARLDGAMRAQQVDPAGFLRLAQSWPGPV